MLSGTTGSGAGGEIPGYNLTTLADTVDPSRVLGNGSTDVIYSTAHLGSGSSTATPGKKKGGGADGAGDGT